MSMLAHVTDGFSDVFRIVDLIGVFCNAVIGGRVAREKRFDYVGFALLGMMSALGGGAVRDVLLNTVPVAFTDPYYLGTALVGALVAYLWQMNSRWTRRLLTVGDGLVLGCWAATGAAKTLSMGFGVLPAILMGITTAIGGSMIRDVSSGSVPKVLHRDTFYVTPAIISAVAMIVCYRYDQMTLGMGLAIVLSIIIVTLALWKNWHTPEPPDWTITLTSKQLRQLLRLRGIKVQRRSHGPLEEYEGEYDEKYQATYNARMDQKDSRRYARTDTRLDRRYDGSAREDAGRGDERREDEYSAAYGADFDGEGEGARGGDSIGEPERQQGDAHEPS